MLKQRVITALILLAGLLVALFVLPRPAWWGFCSLVAFAAGWEWGGLMRLTATPRVVLGALVGALTLVVCALDNRLLDVWVCGASVLFWLLAVPFWLRRRPALGGGVSALLVGLLVLLPAALGMARLRDVSPWLLLAAAALVWVADIGAYFGGRAFGKRKLAPTISPGKSWEGVWSGMLSVLIYGALVFVFALPGVPLRLGWAPAVLLLLVLTALSVIGDLFESLLKRQAGLKDSSQLLPGHGGVLDRIDSLTSTLPLVALLCQLWLRAS